MEDKKAICSALADLLKLTRWNGELERIEYKQEKQGEYVYCMYKNGHCIRVDVTADSGIAIIKDVIKGVS